MDGICTHGNTHLADGLVKGKILECPKHNGRFNLEDGSPARAPICRGIATYPIEHRNGRLFLNIAHAGRAGTRTEKTPNRPRGRNRNGRAFLKDRSPETEPRAAPVQITLRL